MHDLTVTGQDHIFFTIEKQTTSMTAIQLNYLREHWHKQQLMLRDMCAWMAPKVTKKAPNLYSSDLETGPLGHEYCLKLG
jgi:hypothetical protein